MKDNDADDDAEMDIGYILFNFFIGLAMIIIFFIIIIHSKNPSTTIENTFVVDTLINHDSTAVLKMDDIEILVKNYNNWDIGDTLVIRKK